MARNSEDQEQQVSRQLVKRGTEPTNSSRRTKIPQIGRTSMVMEHQVFSEQQQTLVSEGDSTIVLFNYAKNEPQPVSEELRAAIETLEGRSPGDN